MSKLCSPLTNYFFKVTQNSVYNKVEWPFVVISIRNTTTKHWNHKFQWYRQQKIIPIKLPDFHQDYDKMTREEIRAIMKEKGILPPRYWRSPPTVISSTGGVFEPYIPPEGDGKISVLHRGGTSQTLDMLTKKGKSRLAIQKVKSYDDEFDLKTFPEQMQEVYCKAHESLNSKDPEIVSEFATETSLIKLLDNVKGKTIHWKFIKSLEPPRVVHARQTNVITKENIFAQITIRFHTQQILAIYDRFGRLMYGSEILAKDVLEYCVFEKQIANVYGKWRLHDKIIPDWMPQPSAPPRTYAVEPPMEDEEPEDEEKQDLLDTANVEVVRPHI